MCFVLSASTLSQIGELAFVFHGLKLAGAGMSPPTGWNPSCSADLKPTKTTSDTTHFPQVPTLFHPQQGPLNWSTETPIMETIPAQEAQLNIDAPRRLVAGGEVRQQPAAAFTAVLDATPRILKAKHMSRSRGREMKHGSDSSIFDCLSFFFWPAHCLKHHGLRRRNVCFGLGEPSFGRIAAGALRVAKAMGDTPTPGLGIHPAGFTSVLLSFARRASPGRFFTRTVWRGDSIGPFSPNRLESRTGWMEKIQDGDFLAFFTVRSEGFACGRLFYGGCRLPTGTFVAARGGKRWCLWAG